MEMMRHADINFSGEIIIDLGRVLSDPQNQLIVTDYRTERQHSHIMNLMMKNIRENIIIDFLWAPMIGMLPISVIYGDDHLHLIMINNDLALNDTMSHRKRNGEKFEIY